MAGARAQAAGVNVTREQVIAYRVHAHGLHREASSVSELAVLDIGVQEAMGHPAALAFAARLDSGAEVGPDAFAVGPGHRLALAWTLRGAPNVHRRKDLDALAAALYPLSEADATARLNETGPGVKRHGIAALVQFRTAVEQMRAVVTTPMTKGAVSTEVTKRLPEAMRRECRVCKTSHISDSAMRASFLAAGLELQPGTSPPVMQRRTKAMLPDEADPKALARLAVAYLTLLGPAGEGEFAGYLEARRSDVAEHWPDELAEVSVDGRSAWLPETVVNAMEMAPPPDLVRLLGPFDPYLQARDRDLIVPDKTVQKVLWPVLGRPGALFVDGEIAGTWRPKTSAKKLTLAVEAFAPLPPSVWKQVEAEAERVAAVRAAAFVDITRLE